jgi:HlyD family secretion protein
MQGKKLWRYSGMTALLLIAFGAMLWWHANRQPGLRYQTETVSRGAVTRTVTATGTVNPKLTIIVGAAVSGIIQALYCDYNTVVKVGQICAKIDPRAYQAIVDQDTAKLAVDHASLAKDEAKLRYSAITNQRDQMLLKQSSISAEAADAAQAAFEVDKAQVLLDKAQIQADQAALAAAQVDLDYTNIVSPVNGVVVSRNVTVGQTVASSFQTPTLFLIATDLTKMQVDTNVAEGDIGAIRDGQRVSFTVLAFPERVFHGVVAQVRQSPQTVQNVVTYDVIVDVDNQDLALKPGMTASVQIITSERQDVIRVPDQALQYAPPGAPGRSGARLWVLRAGKPEPEPVTTGLDDDVYTEILSGAVKPGDEVIIGDQKGAIQP